MMKYYKIPVVKVNQIFDQRQQHFQNEWHLGSISVEPSNRLRLHFFIEVK